MKKNKVIQFEIRSQEDQLMKKGEISLNFHESVEQLMQKIERENGLSNNSLMIEQPQSFSLDQNIKIIKLRQIKNKRTRKLSEDGSIVYQYTSIIQQQASRQFMYHEPEIPPKVIGHVRWCYKFFACMSSKRTMVLNFEAIRFYNNYQSVDIPQKTVDLQDVQQISSYRKRDIYFLRISTNNGQQIDLKFSSKQVCKQWIQYFDKAINYHIFLTQKKTFYKKDSYKDLLKTLLQNDRTKTIKLEQTKQISSQTNLPFLKNGQTGTIVKLNMKNATRLADFNITNQIGRGAFSTVYRAQRQGRVYALKQIKKDELIRKNQIRYAVTQLNILSKCNNKCEFIIPLHYAFQTQDYLYLALKYLNYGTLKDVVQRRKCLTRKQSFSILCQLVLALEFLHKQKILYRDMKPENILMTKQGHIYLIDFGLSIQLGEEQQYAESFVGTPLYLAPERLQGTGRINAKADIYGVGCLFYYMLHGHAPFEGDTFDSVIHRLQSAEFEIRQDVDGMTEQFIKQTIETNVYKRLSHMSSHPLFQKVDWNKIKKKQNVIMKLDQIQFGNYCQSAGDYDYTEDNFPNKKVNDWFYGGEKSEKSEKSY